MEWGCSVIILGEGTFPENLAGVCEASCSPKPLPYFIPNYVSSIPHPQPGEQSMTMTCWAKLLLPLCLILRQRSHMNLEIVIYFREELNWLGACMLRSNVHSQKACALFLVRQLLEGMGKTLFFRSGNTPLVLSHAQVEGRNRGRDRLAS